ncbi:MAG TPA: sulfite exporter TauE/SafE family protein [Trueperaceae bacterium]
MPTDTALVLLILFGSSFVRSLVGFGDALLAMPLLLLVVGLDVAVPLVGLVAVVVAVILLSLNWREVEFRSLGPLLATALLGAPIGVLLVKSLEGEWLIHALGVLLILFGGYRLIGPRLPEVRHPALTLPLGLLSGIFGGAYNVSGPFALLYAGLRGWSPRVFRASLQGFFIVTSAAIAVSQGVAGFWTPQVWNLFLLSLPLVVTANLGGHLLASRVPSTWLERLISTGIALIGVALVA